MYTVVPKQEVAEHRPRPGEPAVEIIDHREQQPNNLRSKKKRQEQLPYGTLKEQRDSMFQKELKYKKRIEDLEKDSKELVKTYEMTYEENTKLKRLLGNGPDTVKMKQLSKDKKEQKGIIDQLKDENQGLAEKLAELEKEVMAEKLKANDRSWDVQLAKVKKKREEEDSIPTEGPFVVGKVAKKKRIMLKDEDGEKEVDAYDLEVDSLEKETQVLLNKVKLLKREKEQIDYATTMGKGAVTKNKAVAKAINDKLNRDLNKFVIRLQMLKMKQNAARTYCSLITDESNPVIKLKSTEAKSGQATPNPVNTSRDSSRSYKRLSNAPTPKSVNGSNKEKMTPTLSKPQQKVSKQDTTKAKVSKENESQAKRKMSLPENTPTPQRGLKNGQVAQTQRSRDGSIDAADGEKGSAQIWRRVQSSKLPNGNKIGDTTKAGDTKLRKTSSKGRNETPPKTKTDTLMQSIFEKKPDEKNGKINAKPIQNNGAFSGDTKVTKSNNKTKKDVDSTGRYTHGPEPIGRKGFVNKNESKLEKVNDEPYPGNAPPKAKGILKNRFSDDSTEDVPFYTGHSKSNAPVYRINAPDDGFNLIRLHNHMHKIDRSVRSNPVPIKFKERKTFDVRPGKSIIGNSGIRRDSYYRRLDDDDPYYGL